MTAGLDCPELRLTERVQALHAAVLAAPRALCAERAILITDFFKRRADREEPVVLQKARALEHLLRHKVVRIHKGELLVGNFSAHRVGGGLFPELHGIAMLEDLLRFERREVNPFRVDPSDRRRLLTEVLPYWGTRFLALRAFPRAPLRTLAFLADQLSPTIYLINETGGIAHFVPDYARLVALGTEGMRAQVEAARTERTDPDELAFLRAVEVVCDGLDRFAERYSAEARRLAENHPDEERRAELMRIAATCARVPRYPARSFPEGLQAILLAQIALNLESLDHAVCPGRLDQVLWPLYRADLEAGRIDAEQALELLGCFAVKLCEIVPLFSRRLTRFHGGLFNGQVVVVGGTDRDGADATNALSLLFLEVMDKLRTRQPNYHARLHAGAPPEFRRRIAAALAAGAASPALYNDDAIVPMLQGRGFELGDCRDYAAVGCVEPVPTGRGYLSTDAALFNLPMCLELALNRGRRFGAWRRVGVATGRAADCTSSDDLFTLFAAQLRHAIDRLLDDLQAIERANTRHHPTPLTSALLDGCIESATDASAGGARYNGSGVQGVGIIEVADSLAAIEHVVFSARYATLAEVVRGCRDDFAGHEALQARLRGAPKYGNDDRRADAWVARVMALFGEVLSARRNTRGGGYAAGFYSVTSHVAFGEVVGALPSGRQSGRPFSSGISPGRGRDRAGPTAVLRSAASFPPHLAPNGVNLNLALDPWVVAGDPGAARLEALVAGGFAGGCMQMQINVHDPKILVEARDNPGRYPGLLVRVSGYSAYFDDLSPSMKQEIIDRTLHNLTGP